MRSGMCKNPCVPVFVHVCGAGLGLEQCSREWVAPRGHLCWWTLSVSVPAPWHPPAGGHPSSDLSQGSYKAKEVL